MYTLTNDQPTKRTYTSSITGTEINTVLIYTDEDGANWWAFEDLLNIPFIRKKAAEKFTNLYGVGITKEDLEGFVQRLKTLLKSSDTEKYEKAYSEVLQLESIAANTADPVKQSLGLCAVYIMGNDERVDTFSFDIAAEKMKRWALDMGAQAFFLNWLTDGMNAYTTLYNQVSQIVLTQEKQ